MQKLLLEALNLNNLSNLQAGDILKIFEKFKNSETRQMLFDIAEKFTFMTSTPVKKGSINPSYRKQVFKILDDFMKKNPSFFKHITGSELEDFKEAVVKLTIFRKSHKWLDGVKLAEYKLHDKIITFGEFFDKFGDYIKSYNTAFIKYANEKSSQILSGSNSNALEETSKLLKEATDLLKEGKKVEEKLTETVKGSKAIFDEAKKVAPVANSVSEVKKVADNLKSVADLGKEVKAAKASGETVKKGAEAAKVAEKAVEQGANVVKKATQETVKAIAGGKTKIITTVVVAVVALVSAPLIAGWREKASIAKVKELTENALNSKNYQDLAKYIGLLKKMQAKNTFMDKLMVADTASKLAEGNLADIKKGYTICGATMIAASVVLCLLVGVASNVIGTLKEMISNPSFNSIISAIGKLAVLGILLAPALIGVCLIKVAQDGFTEEGPAAFIVSMLAPIVSLCNYCIKGVMELIANAEANKMNNNSSDKDKYVSTLKSMKYQLDRMLVNEKIS